MRCLVARDVEYPSAFAAAIIGLMTAWKVAAAAPAFASHPVCGSDWGIAMCGTDIDLPTTSFLALASISAISTRSDLRG